MARKVSDRRAAIEESHGSEEEPVENLFNDRDLIKRLVDECILSEVVQRIDRKSTRLNSSHSGESRMPSSA